MPGFPQSGWAALATGAVVLAAAETAHATEEIAVLGLELVDAGEGLDEQTAERAAWFTESLREHAADAESRYALAPEGNKDLLEMKLLSGCDDDALGCMAEIGRDLGADRLLYGSLQKGPERYEISLTLIDTREPSLVGEGEDAIPFTEASRSQIDRRARSLYNQLTSVGGVLVVESNAPSGTIFVDGEPAANLVDGRARVDGLDEGEHNISIEAEGYAPYAERVSLGDRDEERMAIDLAPLDDDVARPGRGHRIGFTAAAITTGASAGAWLFFVDQWRQANRDRDAHLTPLVEEYNAEGYGPDEDACASAETDRDSSAEHAARAGDLAEACDDGERAAILNNVFGAATLISAVAAGYFYHQGFIAPDGSAEAGGDDSWTIRVEPQLGPRQVGAGLRLDF